VFEYLIRDFFEAQRLILTGFALGCLTLFHVWSCSFRAVCYGAFVILVLGGGKGCAREISIYVRLQFELRERG